MSNAFDWKGTPSTFQGDRTFAPCKDGLTLSETAARMVRRRTAATGVNPGSIPGLSPTADRQLLTPAERKRRLGK